MLNKLAIATAVAATVTGAAYAQQTTTGVGTPMQAQVLNTLPSNATTVTNYYKQNVYDHSDAKIGEITDVLVGKDGKVDAFIISVGGFLGVGEKGCGRPVYGDPCHRKERQVVSHHECHEGFAQGSAWLQV
jgi:PRC-barrel domain